MASQITLDGADVAGLWTEYINRKFVPGLKARTIFSDYAEPASIPRGAGGHICIWNVPTMTEGSVAALSACSSGTKTDMITITKVTAGVTSYGTWFEIDDLAEQTQIRGALDQYRDIVEYAGGTAIDRLIINEAASGLTSFLHAGDVSTGGVTLAVGDQLKALDLPVIAEYFRSNNAVGWDKLSGDFMLGIHPAVEKTFVTHVTTDELSWAEVNKHVPMGFEQLINNHQFVGRLNGVSVLRTTMIATVTEPDVAAYVNVALARWAVGWLGIGTAPKQASIKIKRPGPQTTNDPLDMCNTMGWKVQAAAKVLDANRGLIVYSSTT